MNPEQPSTAKIDLTAPRRVGPPPLPSSARCPQCGKTLKPKSAFCSTCGARHGEPLPVPTPSHSKVWLSAIVALCAGFAAFIAFVFTARTNVPAVAQESVSPVYVTPPPVQEKIVVADPPEVKPATAPVVLSATPIVTEPKQPRYIRMKTQMLGATTGGGPFEMHGINDEPVIGFRVTTARWGKNSIVRTLQPVYASDNSVVTQSMIVARDGYAVGGVIVDGDDHVTAMRIVFMRIQPRGLSTTDRYESDWIGDPTGDPTHLLGGRGQFVFGIYGRKGMNVDALGLFLLSEAKE